MSPFFKTKFNFKYMSLELKNVEKKVGIETHIYSTNLKLEKNTINVLLGSTLAGKTTLMQIMAIICIKVVLPASVDPSNTLMVFFSNLRFVEYI